MTAEQIREKWLNKFNLSVSMDKKIGKQIHESAIGAMKEYANQELQKRDELLKEFAEAFSSIQILQQQTGKVLSPLDLEYVDRLLSKYNNLKV